MAPKRDRYAALLDTPEFERTVRHQTEAPAAPNHRSPSPPPLLQGSSHQHSSRQNPPVLTDVSSSSPLLQGSSLESQSSSSHQHTLPQNSTYWSSLFRAATKPDRYADILSRNLSAASTQRLPSDASTSNEQRSTSLEADSLDKYGLTVMATTVLDAEHDISIQPGTLSDEFLERIILEIHDQAVSLFLSKYLLIF